MPVCPSTGGTELPRARALLPHNLQAVCELLLRTTDAAVQPEEAFDSLEVALASQQPTSHSVLDKFHGIFPKACMALKEASAAGWSSVRLLRSLIKCLADLVEDAASAHEESMAAQAFASQTDAVPVSHSMECLLKSLWVLCQLSMTLDQVINSFLKNC